MSNTTTKRPLARAYEDALAFRALFPAHCYERWEIAGSVRRAKPEVGDVEHVVIPRKGLADVHGTMFPEQRVVNLLWYRLDELYAAGVVSKHLYTDGKRRWGEKMRGIDYGGMRQEIYSATPDTWGSILGIRTGPWEFSKRMVEQLHPRGLQHQDGQIIYKRNGNIYPTPTEAKFFEACGQRWLEPSERTA